MQNAKIILKDGTDYLTPVDNLDNVKRILAGKIKDIEFPEWKADDEDEKEELSKEEMKAKYEEVFGKKPGNKSIETMKAEIEAELLKATN